MIKTKQFSQAIQSFIFDNVSVYLNLYQVKSYLHRDKMDIDEKMIWFLYLIGKIGTYFAIINE